ncbi:unnamed protein product [Larinioides sclopetarius]|uniref:Uncharacterized protein n=1 Tax=Larinioides sclopetarius TaxID=280406 RepID=A0AAV2B883_9ARAC
MVPTPKLDFIIFSTISIIFLYVSGTFGEESDKFYYAIIEFLSAIADFFYFRLFGSSPD